MAGDGLSSLGRVNLTDLIPSEGLPSDAYKLSVATLSQSLAEYSAVIIQFQSTEAALLRSSLESSHLYFHHKPSYPDMIHTNDSLDWFRTSGYYPDPQLWQETYDYRPGLTHVGPSDSPSALPYIFSMLGRAARDILDAIGFYLNLRSCPFSEMLDNSPLRGRDISSSVLSICCHGRPSFQATEHQDFANEEDDQLGIFPEHQFDKSFITVVKSDKGGLRIRDVHGRWILVDVNLGPQEAIVYCGLALYHATAGYVSPSLYRATHIGNVEGNHMGRCSLVFKLMPNPMSTLSCSEMKDAGHVVEAQFQIPVSVEDFMQRSYHTDQVFIRNGFTNYNFPTSQDGGSIKSMMKRRNNNNSRCKPLPPSKRLRLEAQRVLKDRVQDIADKKGLRLRFCNLKECETHIGEMDSPCANTRHQIGWPHGVPFVHPHDLPNKAKIGFLEAYEPGWTTAHDMELSQIEPVAHQ